MARKRKLTTENIGYIAPSDRSLATWRPHPRIYKMIKKDALKNKTSIGSTIEKMVLFYLNEAE